MDTEGSADGEGRLEQCWRALWCNTLALDSANSEGSADTEGSADGADSEGCAEHTRHSVPHTTLSTTHDTQHHTRHHTATLIDLYGSRCGRH